VSGAADGADVAAGTATYHGFGGSFVESLLEQPGLVGEHDRLDPVTEAEFLEDVRDVCLHGRLADVELVADLRVGQAGRDQPQDFVFSPGEFADLFRRGRARDAGELLDRPR